ncbi:MAG TPA: Ku protein [Acidimicrobiia bacterium]
MARSLWTGSISFGLVNIPVRIFPAIREHDVHFHQIAPDGSRVHNQRVSGKSGKVVEYQDLRKGYETSKGKYVVFEPDELERLAPAATKTIEIEDFVPLEQIDPISFERTYHLTPAGTEATKAYALLAAVMEDRQRIGIGRIVIRERQHLAAVRPFGKGLALSTLLFADEVVPQSDVPDVPSRKPTLSTREKQLAAQIVDSLATDWDPKRYRDDYERQLRKVIRAKQQGKQLEPQEEAPTAQVIDLMDALRASLEGGSGGARPNRSPRKQAKKQTAKKRAAKRTTKRPAKRRAGAKPRASRRSA